MVSFADRHIGTPASAQRIMLDALGVADTDAPVEQLMRQAVPASIYTEATAESTIPRAASETEALAELRALASRNTVNRPMIGLGYYGTITPQVIQRNVLENPSWYTAYTPYQPEISQGRLEALINFQTMVADLAGNQMISDMLTRLRSHLHTFRLYYHAGLHSVTKNEHLAVADAVARQDPDGAEEAMRAHLVSALERLETFVVDGSATDEARRNPKSTAGSVKE